MFVKCFYCGIVRGKNQSYITGVDRISDSGWVDTSGKIRQKIVCNKCGCSSEKTFNEFMDTNQEAKAYGYGIALVRKALFGEIVSYYFVRIFSR